MEFSICLTVFIFESFPQLFPLLLRLISSEPWLTRLQNFNQPSKHPRYMVKCTQLGANPSVPNWVHNLCSKLGFLRQIPHSRILLIYVPNWVHNSYTQLGAKNMYPIVCKESVPNWVHKYILNVLFELYVLKYIFSH